MSNDKIKIYWVIKFMNNNYSNGNKIIIIPKLNWVPNSKPKVVLTVINKKLIVKVFRGNGPNNKNLTIAVSAALTSNDPLTPKEFGNVLLDI